MVVKAIWYCTSVYSSKLSPLVQTAIVKSKGMEDETITKPCIRAVTNLGLADYQYQRPHLGGRFCGACGLGLSLAGLRQLIVSTATRVTIDFC